MSDELPAKPQPMLSETLVSTIEEFFESIPPGKQVLINKELGSAINSTYYLDLPTIQLHCSTEACSGMRFFAPVSDKLWVKPSTLGSHFIHYKCKNCEKTRKLYAITLRASLDTDICRIQKIGEIPSFGPHTPTRLISLVGPDKEDFFKGRRSESQGFGIGAFAYYRRIVESQKSRILDELIRVCQKTNASAEIVKDLEAAKKETQFTKAVESIKHGLPQTLLIHGQHNPLMLLHNALSEALHAHTDEECLELAQNIRIVLTELADRVSQTLKEESELDLAVSQLMNRAQKKKRQDLPASD